MSLPKFEIVTPKTVARAISLNKEGGKFLAGGTDLLVAMKQKIKDPKFLIDLSTITSLKKVKWNKKSGLMVGALVTLSQLKENSLVQRHLPVLSEIIPLVSAPQLQNMGTIGGNLCLDTRCYYYNQPVFLKKRWESCFKIGGQVCHVVKGGDTCHAVYSGDMAAPLIALGASVKLAGPKNTKELELQDFFTGLGIRPNILKFDQILTEIAIPLQPEYSGCSYQKLRLRDTLDFPLLGVASYVNLEGRDGVCRDFRLVLSAVGPAPIVVKRAATIVCGKKFTSKLYGMVSQEALKKIHPVANTASSPKYRREMVPVLIKKAIHEALERANNTNRK